MEEIARHFTIFGKLILRLMMIDVYSWVVTKNVVMAEWVLEPTTNGS
jgi:hypothetical protein